MIRLEFESISECWNYCEENLQECKAISFYRPTNKCQIYKNDSLTLTYDRDFESLTSNKSMNIRE